MYQINYFRKRSSDGIGFHEVGADIVRTWIGIIIHMIRYYFKRNSIDCFEVVDVGRNRISDSIKDRKVIIHWDKVS